jgi:WD40 repeat protein
MTRPSRTIVALVLATALAGCAGRPRLIADASAPGASEVRWACHDSLLVVALRGWGVALVESKSGRERGAWRLPDIPPRAAQGLAVSAAGETLAVATADSVRVFATRGLIPLLARQGNAATLALSDDGSELLWTDGTLGQLLEVRSGDERWHGMLEAGPGALQWAGGLGRFIAPLGRQVMPAGEDDPVGFSLGPFEGALPWKLALSSAGGTLAVAESTNCVSCWDLRTREMRRRLVLGGAAFEHLALSRDALLLATSQGGRARVLWARSGQTVAAWVPHAGAEIEDLAFASDGSRLATVGADGTVRTWTMPAAPGQRPR